MKLGSNWRANWYMRRPNRLDSRTSAGRPAPRQALDQRRHSAPIALVSALVLAPDDQRTSKKGEPCHLLKRSRFWRKRHLRWSVRLTTSAMTSANTKFCTLNPSTSCSCCISSKQILSILSTLSSLSSTKEGKSPLKSSCF